jgi:large subunit ribosomal protein L23
MKNLYEVIRRPLLTEKSTLLKESQQTLVFEVHRDATKPEIKKAVETLFERKVAERTKEVELANRHKRVAGAGNRRQRTVAGGRVYVGRSAARRKPCHPQRNSDVANRRHSGRTEFRK